jgi:hypothetical protein
MHERKRIFEVDMYIVQFSGLLDHFRPPIVHVTPLKTPFGLVIPLLQSQSHVTTFTHNYLLRCYDLQIYNPYTFVSKITYNTITSLH